MTTHPPRADGEDDGGLSGVSSPSRSPTRQAGWGPKKHDPIRLARMVKMMAG